jgi:ATP-binding cassette subfamily C (CFTR/MRP) protein 1
MGLQCSHQVDATFGPTVSGCRDDFDFTIFFEDTFFAIIPSAVLLLAAPFQLLALSRQRSIVLRGRLLSCKLVLTIAFLAVQVASLVGLVSQPQRPLSTTTGAAIISVISGCVICVLSYYSHIRSPTPSTLLQIYLGMSLLLDVPRLRTSWLQLPQGFSSIMATVSVGIKLLLFFVEAMGKRGLLRAGFNFRGAEAMIGLFNRSLFWWLNGILLTGHKRPLQTQDIYDIDEKLASPIVYAQLKEKLNTSESFPLLEPSNLSTNK